jgi:hypothetical protein
MRLIGLKLQFDLYNLSAKLSQKKYNSCTPFLRIGPKSLRIQGVHFTVLFPHSSPETKLLSLLFKAVTKARFVGAGLVSKKTN